MRVPSIAEKLSLAVITKNEVHNIGDCLASWANLGPVIVVDDFSADGTALIANKYGAKVIQRKFDNFSAQKQYAVSQTCTDWVLVVDADERISDELRSSLTQLKLDSPTTAYSVHRDNYYLGNRVRFSGWNPDLVTRIFNKKACQFSGDLVHESVVGYNRVIQLHGPLLHFSYINREDVEKKIEKYSDLGAQNLAKKQKKRPSNGRILASSAWAFLRTLILQKGIFDGSIGWEIACMNSKTTFLKYKKFQSSFSTND